MDAFKSYSSPPSSVAYSAQFFASLTFGKVLGLDFPAIAPASSVVSFVFDEETPFDAAGTIILPGETIPELQDLLPIWNGMPAAFARGSHCVLVCFLGSSVLTQGGVT